jgi:predicted NUDIX family NTP pyrophosphohydrolase
MNNKGVVVKNDFSSKIFFAKKRYNSSNVLVPFSYNHNRDAANNLINSFSLAWAGDSGIAKTFHDTWQQIKQNQETVKTFLRVNRRVAAALQKNNFFEIKGTQYLLSKTQKTIPMKDTMDVELVVA